METFKQDFLRDLKEINNLLKTRTDNCYRQQLNKDKNILLSLTGQEMNHDIVKRIESKIEDDEVTLIIIKNKLFNFNLRKFFLVKPHKKGDSSRIFNKFLLEDTFKLNSLYMNLINNNTLFYDKKNNNNNILGETISIKSLDKHYVTIQFNNRIIDYSVLVHELGHIQQNSKKLSSNYISNFTEAYSNFLELEYFDYIKKIGFEKEAYNLKADFLSKFGLMFDCLYEEIDDYSSMDNINKYIFYSRFKNLISSLLAFKFYNIYNENSKEALELLDIFNKNICDKSDVELLKSIGISFNDFKNNNYICEFLSNLRNGKAKIKQKS